MTHRIHMVGIGGIGMSALAQLYAERGYRVTGSDRGTSPVTDLLNRKGISVTIGHDAVHVDADVELLVYSDAVPEQNAERVRGRELGVRECSYFEALGDATQSGISIVVSGTHGKTTTTAMLAKVLVDTGKNPTVVAGSILAEQGSNFVAGSPDLYVIEGCEYRRHFLHLHPHILVITNIELDHTDYYRDLADMQDAFRSAAELVPEGGIIVADMGSDTVRDSLTAYTGRIMSYRETSVPVLAVPGAFNEANARAAKTAALAYDAALSEQEIDRALAGFTGTWRRFEYKGVTVHGTPVYDDYAHHPTAVRETLAATRALFPGKRIIAAFHPHLYSRTRDFMDEFAHALAAADEVILAPIYAAREAPVAGVTSEQLAARITALGTQAHAFSSLDAVRDALANTSGDSDVILTMGAGDIYTVANAIVTR